MIAKEKRCATEIMTIKMRIIPMNFPMITNGYGMTENQ